jgi:hypothetical protein
MVKIRTGARDAAPLDPRADARRPLGGEAASCCGAPLPLHAIRR